MNLTATPVYDPRTRQWRVIVLMMDSAGKVTAAMPVDGYKTEQDAQLACYAMLVVLQKKAQAHHE